MTGDEGAVSVDGDGLDNAAEKAAFFLKGGGIEDFGDLVGDLLAFESGVHWRGGIDFGFQLV